MNTILRWMIFSMALIGLNTILQADPIGGPGSNCGTCEGAIYTLTYSGSPISSTATTQTFQITFDVNDASYSGGGSFLNAVAIKVAAPSDLVSASLVSAPTGFSLIPNTGLDASGCSGGSGGFLCVESSGKGASVSGGPYDFVYDVTVDTGTLLTGLDAASVKARYVDNDGNKAGALLSENITLQTEAPEPTSALMLGSGLLMLGLLGKTWKLQSARV